MNVDEVRWQDEILQLMYWMRGEKLGADASAIQLNRFLGLDPMLLGKVLRHLVDMNLVESHAGPPDQQERFCLTARGIEEGKRRFYDEFSPYLGKESHIVCADPDCDCHSPDWNGVCPSLSDRR